MTMTATENIYVLKKRKYLIANETFLPPDQMI